jgi:hypothetical protein
MKNIALFTCTLYLFAADSFGQFQNYFNNQLPEYRNYWRAIGNDCYNAQNNYNQPSRRNPDYLEVTESIHFYRKLIIEPRYYNNYNVRY